MLTDGKNLTPAGFRADSFDEFDVSRDDEGRFTADFTVDLSPLFEDVPASEENALVKWVEGFNSGLADHMNFAAGTTGKARSGEWRDGRAKVSFEFLADAGGNDGGGKVEDAAFKAAHRLGVAVARGKLGSVLVPFSDLQGP